MAILNDDHVMCVRVGGVRELLRKNASYQYFKSMGGNLRDEDDILTFCELIIFDRLLSRITRRDVYDPEVYSPVSRRWSERSIRFWSVEHNDILTLPGFSAHSPMFSAYVKGTEIYVQYAFFGNDLKWLTTRGRSNVHITHMVYGWMLEEEFLPQIWNTGKSLAEIQSLAKRERKQIKPRSASATAQNPDPPDFGRTAQEFMFSKQYTKIPKEEINNNY